MQAQFDPTYPMYIAYSESRYSHTFTIAKRSNITTSGVYYEPFLTCSKYDVEEVLKILKESA